MKQGDTIELVIRARLPWHVRRLVYAIVDRGDNITIQFHNGHEVPFSGEWDELVAACILVHDLPPI